MYGRFTLGEDRDRDVPAGRRAGTAPNGPAKSNGKSRQKVVGESEPHATPSNVEPAEEHHEPSEHSFWPIVLAVGLLLVGVGILNQVAIAALGGILVLVALVGWLWQPWIS